MRNCSDSMFGTVTQDFPNTCNGQCYFQMIVNVNNNHSKCFKSKINKSRIVQDLKSMQSIGFDSVSEALCKKLKKEHSSETSFFQKIEQSYWDGNRKS